MVYSNDEVQDKLNNSSNSNADAKTVRDLSASNDKNAKEESNKAKQQILIEEAIENNEAFKRLRQTLYKTTSGRVQVSAEDIADIYSSMVSPSANTVGNKGAFFVDDGLITTAVGAMCYDISVEENGIVLNVNGTLNVEATKRQVAMISGNVPREEMDKYKAALIAEKQQYLKDEKTKSEILSDKYFKDSKAAKFLYDFSKMSKEEQDAYMSTDEGRRRFEEALNDEKFDKAIEFFRKLGNLETADEVKFMHLAASAAKTIEKMQVLTGEELEKAKEHLEKIAIQLKISAVDGNKETLRFMNPNGQPNLKAIALAYREFVDLYSVKEDIQFMQQASEKQLYDVKGKLASNKKLNPQDKKFVEEIIGRNISLIFSENTTIRNGTEAKEIAIAELGILCPDLVDDDGKINKDEIIKLYNSVHNPPVNSIEKIRANAKAMHEQEVNDHINGLIGKINTNTFEERTSEDLDEKEGRRKQLREDRRKQRDEEKAQAQANPFEKMRRNLEKLRDVAKIENISKALNLLYQQSGVEGEYQSAIVASAYLYNRNQAFTAMNRGDGIELAEYEKNYKMIEAYIKTYSEQYKEIVDKDGKIRISAMENIQKGLFNGIEVTDMLKEFGMTPRDLTEIFETAQTDRSSISLLRQGVFKTVKNSMKTVYDKIRPKKLLEAGQEQHNLSQVEINALFAENGEGVYARFSEEEEEKYKIDSEDFSKQVNSLLNGGLTRNVEHIKVIEARVAGEKVLSQEEIDALIAKEMGLVPEMSFEDRLKVDVDDKSVVKKTTMPEKAILKVDEKTLRRMAFEICQKNNLDPLQVNTAGIDELQTLLNCYGEGLEAQIQLQDGKPVQEQEGMEI